MEHLVRILKENGPYQTLQLFDDDSDGNIIPQELMLYLESVELEVDRKVVIDTFFGDHK
jgi:Ca2+-binding EF-hand superfamily protein